MYIYRGGIAASTGIFWMVKLEITTKESRIFGKGYTSTFVPIRYQDTLSRVHISTYILRHTVIDAPPQTQSIPHQHLNMSPTQSPPQHIYIPNLVGGQMVKLPVSIFSDTTADDASTDDYVRCRTHFSLPLSSLDDDDDEDIPRSTAGVSAKTNRTSSPSPSMESVSDQDE